MASFFSTLVWVTMPWMHGITIWAAAFPLVAGQIFLLESSTALIDSLKSGKPLWPAGFLNLLALFSYQAFWGGLGPVLLLIAIAYRDRKDVLVRLAKFAAFYLVAHFASAGLTLVQQASLKDAELRKTVNVDFLSAYLRSFSSLIVALFVPFRDGIKFFQIPVFVPSEDTVRTQLGSQTVWALEALLAYYLWKRKTFWVSFSSFCGLAVALIVFCLAGYGFATSGIFSRTMVATSVWLAVLSGALLLSILPRKSRPRIATLCTTCLIVGPVLAFAHVSETLKWVRSWDFQQEILRQAPTEALLKAPAQSLVVLTFIRPAHVVETFDAFWDITAALIAKDERLSTHYGKAYFATVARPTEWRSTWDGSSLAQAWCVPPGNPPIWRLPAGKVFLWDFPSGSLNPAFVAPLEIGCGE